MEPEIRYCTTSDGVSIAYQVIGRGPALVSVSNISLSHLSLSWQWPATRSRLEARAADYTVVRYDGRGSGLSQRESADFSLEARLRDLEAVVERTQAGSVGLLAWANAALAAIAYTARNPDRVSALVLHNGYASGRRWYEESPYGKFITALREVTEEQWEFVTQAYASRTLGAADPELVAHVAELYRAAMTPEAALKHRDVAREIDVTSLLKDVAVPTLVLHQEEGEVTPLALSRELASAIPNARIVITQGWETGARATNDFLAAALGTALSAEAEELPQGMTAILFIDIVDSTALTERLGDAAFRAKARDVAAALRSIIAEGGGRTIEGPTLGDGVLATFASARQAIEAALACGRSGDEAGMPLHLGLHAGDVLRESDPGGRDNVYGGAVNIAARISGLSAPGEVLVSGTVRDLARTSAGVRFEDRGEQALKGVGEAVRVWAVVEAQEPGDRKQKTGGA